MVVMVMDTEMVMEQVMVMDIVVVVVMAVVVVAVSALCIVVAMEYRDIFGYDILGRGYGYGTAVGHGSLDSTGKDHQPTRMERMMANAIYGCMGGRNDK